MKQNHQYDSLLIPTRTIVAAFAFWVVKNLEAIPTNLAEGTYALQMELSQRGHEIWMTREQLTLALYRATDNHPVLSEWFKRETKSNYGEGVSVSYFNGTMCHNLGHQLWNDACATQRIKDYEASLPWWQKLWDWLH